jgi:hypothetical protein
MTERSYSNLADSPKIGVHFRQASWMASQCSKKFFTWPSLEAFSAKSSVAMTAGLCSVKYDDRA